MIVRQQKKYTTGTVAMSAECKYRFFLIIAYNKVGVFMLNKLAKIFRFIFLPFILLGSLLIIILTLLGGQINSAVTTISYAPLSNVNSKITVHENYYKESVSLEESRRKLRVAIKSHKINTLKKKRKNN